MTLLYERYEDLNKNIILSTSLISSSKESEKHKEVTPNQYSGGHRRSRNSQTCSEHDHSMLIVNSLGVFRVQGFRFRVKGTPGWVGGWDIPVRA